MKRILTLIVAGIFLFSANSGILAAQPEKNTEKNTVKAQIKAKAEERKTAREEKQAQKEELKQLAAGVKAKHRETVNLMKEIQKKKQEIKKSVTALKEDNQAVNNAVNQVRTEVKTVLANMKDLKGIGVKNQGLWGQFNKARQNKDLEAAKAVLKQIEDNINAKNEKLRQIIATLDGILVDLAP